MSSFVRSFLPLLLAVVLGLAGAPTHTGTSERVFPAGQSLYDDGHCASHEGHGHATAAECLQVGHCISLSPCTGALAREPSQRGVRHAPHDERAKSTPPEASTPPPRSA
jgi:hypothetical protein